MNETIQNSRVGKPETIKLLTVSASIELVLGLVLLVDPSIAVRLLFSAEIGGAGVPVSRLCGIGLTALAIACWRGGATSSAFRGLLFYNALAAIYLGFLCFGGAWVGILLWPAVAIHLLLTIFFARIWFRSSAGKTDSGPDRWQDAVSSGRR